MSGSKRKVIFEDEELRVTEYDETIVYIEDRMAPPLSDSVLQFKSQTFWRMVRACRKGKGKMIPINKKPITCAAKCQFIEDWSDWFYENTSTFEGSLGRQLAYLWPAVVKGNQIEVAPQSAIVKRLRQAGVPASNTIWNYIDVVSGG